MKKSDEEIKKQIREEKQVWIQPKKEEDISLILNYLREEKIEIPTPYPNPRFAQYPDIPFWPISIDYKDKKATEIAGVLACSCYSSQHEIITTERFFKLINEL